MQKEHFYSVVRFYAPSVESGYSSGATATMSRTRSQHTLDHRQRRLQQHDGGGGGGGGGGGEGGGTILPGVHTSSSGEDSYGSGSRPHSIYGTYNGRSAAAAAGTRTARGGRSGRYDDYDDYDSPPPPPERAGATGPPRPLPPPPLPPAARSKTASGHLASGHRTSSYTRDYIKNLPPTGASAAAPGTQHHSRSAPRDPRDPRDPSPPTSGGGRTSGYEHSSFSSQSSEKSDPPAFTALPTSRSHGHLYRENSRWEKHENVQFQLIFFFGMAFCPLKMQLLSY